MYNLLTLPGDEVRQIMWRFTNRFDLQMIVQTARSVARSTVARLVASGARNTHDWTPAKASLLEAFDATGLTAVFMEPHQGGVIKGPKNLALSLVAFELAWVDSGSATCSMASNLALAPIHEKGTPEQRDYYMSRCTPAQPGENRQVWRGAFALTEPLPFVGVDTGIIAGKIRIVEWEEGKEPMLQVDKRGRFITNMDFANFVTAAVDTDDPRIKSSCMVILEETDPGTFDRGSAVLKMVHQLSSTRDPAFNLKIPASRIIGGYTIKKGVIVPNYSHNEIIGAVFHRTRIPVGIMSSAKLLSAVEPVIRYHRQRFRGGDATPGTPRYELGLQQKEDVLHRLIDIWATGEAGCSLGFTTARKADVFDPIEKAKNAIMTAQDATGPRAQLAILRKKYPETAEYLSIRFTPEAERSPDQAARIQIIAADTLVRYLALDAECSVLIPACKLWCTGQSAIMLREAVALMGGYGITEDCPGFLMHKWIDCQLEATYEGPEAVQRRQLTATMTNKLFLVLVDNWTIELDRIAKIRPGLGAYTIAAAFRMWRFTLDYLLTNKDTEGKKLYHQKRHGVTFLMADAISWLVASRCLIQDILELETKGLENFMVTEGLDDLCAFYADLSQVHAARTAGEVGRICAELIYGFRAHEATHICRDDTSDLLAIFAALRQTLDAALGGARLAKDRAALALTKVMIPEALGYPM
ncbi:Acyl-CoA dehydrogenase [Desulfovibrionales bacterium]